MSASMHSPNNFGQSDDDQNTQHEDDRMAIAELSDETLEAVAGGRVTEKSNPNSKHHPHFGPQNLDP